MNTPHSETSIKTGVIVARFQIDELHSGHKRLIQRVVEENENIIFFLGISPIEGSKRNPLSFPARKQMVKEHMLRHHYMQCTYSVHPIVDRESDIDWSIQLDKFINNFAPNSIVRLYGCRDSFIKCYSGKYPCTEIEPHNQDSSTSIRSAIGSIGPLGDFRFRRGVIYAIQTMHPVVASVVDIIAIKNNRVLIGRKANEENWRFPGGFVDHTDKSLEHAARREFIEETSLVLENDPEYLGSILVDDWRFRKSPDKAVMSSIFYTHDPFGHPKANDDLIDIKYHPVDQVRDILCKGHQAIYDLFVEKKMK
jgi:bifunctional NMN adenylyltransferase/nudix hydrolase